MKLVRSVKLKLNIPIENIRPTVEAYTKAFNTVCKVGWDDQDFNGVSLHHKTYRATREFLPAQLACSARMKATDALKGVRARIKRRLPATCPQSKQCSVRFDARSYNIWLDRNEISLLTVEGRKKLPIFIPEYFKQYLDWQRTSADLFIRRGMVFLTIVFEKDVPDPIPTNQIVGIDRGINKLAVTSDNKFYNGGQVKQVSRRIEKLRSALQSCGTRSAQRHLQKLSRKENRFRADVNHRIAKQIVQSLNPGATIVLEDLKSIRSRTRHRKRQRREFHSWNFYQLQTFLTYKAQGSRMLVEYVDARYTSQKCSRCGHISRSNRKSQSVFKCRQCGFSLNADLNASRNIRQNYLDAIRHPDRVAVNRPIVAYPNPQVCCSPSGLQAPSL